MGTPVPAPKGNTTLTDIAEATGAAPAEGAAGRKRKGSGLDSMVLPELKQLAGSLGLKGTGAMRKGQLIAAIQSAQGGSSNGGRPPGAPAQRRPPHRGPLERWLLERGRDRRRPLRRRHPPDPSQRRRHRPPGGR